MYINITEYKFSDIDSWLSEVELSRYTSFKQTYCCEEDAISAKSKDNTLNVEVYEVMYHSTPYHNN